MNIYLTSIFEAAIIAAQNKISENCNLPNSDGTISWGHPPRKAVDIDLWFIQKPPTIGWGNDGEHLTQAQMMSGVDMTDIVEMERDESWFPAATPLPEDE